MKIISITSLVLIALLASPIYAADLVPAARAKRSPAEALNGKKDLSFDDEVLEGMNKNPMDSVENLSKRDGLIDGHIYHKKNNFKVEMHDASQEAGFLP